MALWADDMPAPGLLVKRPATGYDLAKKWASERTLEDVEQLRDTHDCSQDDANRQSPGQAPNSGPSAAELRAGHRRGHRRRLLAELGEDARAWDPAAKKPDITGCPPIPWEWAGPTRLTDQSE